MSDDLFQRLMHHPSLWERLTGLVAYLWDGRDAEVVTKLDAADRIAALEAERDQALSERDDNAAALREFIADPDRLEAEVARLREMIECYSAQAGHEVGRLRELLRMARDVMHDGDVRDEIDAALEGKTP